MNVTVVAILASILFASLPSHTVDATTRIKNGMRNSPVQLVTSTTTAPLDVRPIKVGGVTLHIPTGWKRFNANESAILRKQFIEQSREIYKDYHGAEDPTDTVDVIGFHISGNAGAFLINAIMVPPQSDSISTLESQIDDKMKWGVKEGYIRQYLGRSSINHDQVLGFYIKAIQPSGNLLVSGYLKPKKGKNVFMQLTLSCPETWNEKRATTTLTDILKSVAHTQ